MFACTTCGGTTTLDLALDAGSNGRDEARDRMEGVVSESHSIQNRSEIEKVGSG